ncbi:MAG: OmpA family protein [Labilithrix sp.]|nr:OmpA family protein [Labilithrix sp.]MCW5812596.1 OmpA family protein [Labilithrix sp.]
MVHRSPFLFVLALGALAAACGGDKKPAASPTPPADPSITSAFFRAPESRPVSPSIAVSDEIARTCKIDINSIDGSPKFEFDKSELLPADHVVLGKIARCVRDGHLGDGALMLVGRADPRGTTEYNMALGARRAHAVGSFLTQLGLDPARLQETSRGELDAVGTDEPSWQLDRRVDIVMAHE